MDSGKKRTKKPKRGRVGFITRGDLVSPPVLPWLAKSNESVDVVGHDDESNAAWLSLRKVNRVADLAVRQELEYN